jgi:NADPH2:quinone reductase
MTSSRAIRVHAQGGVEQLKVESVAEYSVAPGEALVRVAYAGVNFIDIYKRSGLYKIPLPSTLGEEGAGVVEAIGDGVTDVQPGDRVAWASAFGSYADFVIVPSAKLVHVPEKVDLRLAAAVMLQGMTAHYLSRTIQAIKPGDRALIHAAAGGVGLLLTQIAKMHGGFVIATAGSPEKCELAKQAGADHVIDYTKQDFEAEVKRITEGKGVHVVYDSVGKETFLKGLNILVPRGMMVAYGNSSGVAPAIEPLLLSQKGSLFLTRPTLAHYVATRAELTMRAGDLFDWIGKGQLNVRIGAEFPLEKAGEAQAALEGRKTTGKVLLKVL